MRLIDASELMKFYTVNENGQRIPERDCDNFPITVSIADVKKKIRDAPTIEAAPIVHGKRIPDNEVSGLYMCNKCHIVHHREPKHCYCPNCGAKMK